MAEISLGVIYPAGGGPKRATENQLDPTAAVWAHSYRVQHWAENSDEGRGFVGNSSMNSGGDGLYGVVPSKAEADPWPMYESPIDVTGNGFNMANIYIDADNPADGFLVTAMTV
jgi:hypothetical protein